jgi:hypothetical protein
MRKRWIFGLAVAVGFVMPATSTYARQVSVKPEPATTHEPKPQARSPIRSDDWPRVIIQDPLGRVAIESALGGALRWFADTQMPASADTFPRRTGMPAKRKTSGEWRQARRLPEISGHS